MNNYTLVTGATSGIGEACAIRFANEKHNLIITGRRKEKLINLAGYLSQKYQVKVLWLNFDIRDRKEVDQAIDSLPVNVQIKILINNAGLAAGLHPIQDGSIDDWEQMIDTNVKGLLYITKKVANLMIGAGQGHIINIGSIAGKEVYANGNVYCATKHAVDALTKGIRIDLLPYGIKVTQIAPGLVETEFSIVRFKGDTSRADNVYKGFMPLKGEDIAEVAYYVTTLPNHVNINDLIIVPTAQANSTTVLKKEN